MEKQQQTLQIVSLQTHLTQEHYQSYSVLKDYFLRRIHSGKSFYSSQSNPILVVLPECTGTWLYYMCVSMPRFLRRLSTNCHTLFLIYTLITHCRLFSKQLYKNYHSKCTWLGLIKHSWFSLFADQTFQIYRNLFSELARETNTFIVAGSIFVQKDNLYNMSYLFEPNHGSICLQTGKIYPVSDENSFIHSYQQLPMIYSIPNTNIDIGILICADSWMPEVYELYNQMELVSHRRFLFIIVALNLGLWNISWPGYDSTVDTPVDVKSEHLQSYSLSEAWLDYAVKRGFDVLEKRKIFEGYGIVCCQGVLNLMNDIQGQGESMILIKRSKNEETILIKAEKFDDECLLTCLF